MKPRFNNPLKIWGVKRNPLEKRKESQSGGAFSLIAEYFLERDAIVYGCGYDDDLNVVYLRIDNVDDLVRIKGSKYVKAHVGGAFRQVKQDLENNKIVLFSGTSCYITGIKNYISSVLSKEKSDNLYTVDLVCHGTPSHQVYKDYVKAMEEKFKKKITAFDFRFKHILTRGGGNTHGTTNI